ncbi:MAG: thiamine-phosphate kinase, partial [Bacteroidales bacterium]|nr:thiamine-phosphate kinase [Bacteroidales bacterium]
MKLKEIGEFGFIGRFAHRFDDLVKEDDHGIGDDCALLSISESENHLISTDLLIEDVHFLKDKITPEELGHKALAVNLSDIAAMGGQPLYSFLSIGIPKDTDVHYLDRFMEGYHQLSEKYHVPLMGGDTTSSGDQLIINVAVVGTCAKQETRLRSMAQDNDIICVSGSLGDSAGGLKVRLDKLALTHDKKALIQRHHLPEPRIKEGRFLAQQNGTHAMMDISDGIASDLNHILKSSNKSAVVELNTIPTSQLLQEIAKQENWNLASLATSGGEDYELLFTV